MTGTEGKPTIYDTFNGLRTDCPATKVDPSHSPDCADMQFVPSGMETRHPLVVRDTAPTNIVAREEFTGRDGSVYQVVLCEDGSLYGLSGGVYTLLDQVAAGSTMNTVVAYGRIYMAFFVLGEVGGSDAPRSWDGQSVYRVSQGGPGDAPSVTCITLPSVTLVESTPTTSVPVTSATPTDPQEVQVGGGGSGDYDPPVYEIYYTTLTVVTSAPHGLTAGNVISITGNTRWNVTVAYVSQIIDAETFKISFSTQDDTVGTGGDVGISAPLLSRKNNEVTATTATPHRLRVGYQVAISGVSDLSYPIDTIEVNASSFPGEAEITFTSDQGFVPGDTFTISDVPFVDVGGGVMGYDIRDGIATVTMNSAHGLSAGLGVIVSLHTYSPRAVTVAAILSDTVWTYETNEPNVTDTGGYTHVPWPGEDGTVYTITEVPSPTTIRFAFSSSDFTWTGGTVDFPWNGVFYVDAVPSSTTFQYRQSGPDATLQTGTGTVTPQGQISTGEHQVVQHFILEDGTITPPSPPARFTAKVYQYPLVTMAIGPANVKARVLSFTGVNGGDFAMLLIPARVGGLQVSTTTVIQDNTTQSAIVDFPDTALLSATRIDIPGNNLFECFPLTTPDGVEWYSDRLFWKGGKNIMLGMQNMAFDGGTLYGSTAPLGWTVADAGGSVVQDGFMPVYQIAAGQTGRVTQSCVRRYDGGQIMLENTRYTIRIWVDGAHAGSIKATISSASLPFTSTANFAMTSRGYMQADFDTITPASIPDDMMLTIESASADQVEIRDMQMVLRDNPNLWPTELASYVKQPGTYDWITGVIGPVDDSTELRANFVLQESLYFITGAGRLYYVQQIGNAEPSSWDVQRVSDMTPAFNANSVTTGNGWAAWGGDKGAFWFTGGIPSRASAIIDPTWKAITNIRSTWNDADQKRVYFALGTSMMVYDYRELELGGSGKWCPWNRPIVHVSQSSEGTLFVSGQKTYELSDNPGIADADFGDIGGYYTFAPLGASSMYQKLINYIGMRMSGMGTMSPFLCDAKTTAVVRTLMAQVMDNLADTVVEYNGVNLRFRQLFLKIGQPGLAFSMELAQIQANIDPNSPASGVRR